MDFYIHTCQGCCYPSLFLCCPKTWTPGILLPACPGHVPLQQAYRDRHGDIRVVGVLYCRQATTWQIKQQYILIGREGFKIRITGGLWPPAASNSTELTFFPLLIFVGVICSFVATQTWRLVSHIYACVKCPVQVCKISCIIWKITCFILYFASSYTIYY